MWFVWFCYEADSEASPSSMQHTYRQTEREREVVEKGDIGM